jgi:hypothetical protein
MAKSSNNKRQTRKIVELSFDPESFQEFPNLNKTTNNNNSSRSVSSAKSNKSNKSSKSTRSNNKSIASNASSDSGSAVSAVTPADFNSLAEGLSKDLSKLIRDECSVMTSGTDLTMITLLKDELEAGRKQQAATLKMMNESMQMMTNMMTQFAPKSPQPQPNPQHNTTVSQSTKKAPPSESVSQSNEKTPAPESEQINNESIPDRTMMTQPESDKQYDVPPFSKGLIPKSQRRVTIENATMHEDAQHPTPGSTGATPPPKKSRGSNATTTQRKLDESFARLRPKHKEPPTVKALLVESRRLPTNKFIDQ